MLAVSCLVHYDTLLQNATDNRGNCGSCFITKRDKGLLQNASHILLQNATIITKFVEFITKWDSYYKMRR